jgi:hypothetical protein
LEPISRRRLLAAGGGAIVAGAVLGKTDVAAQTHPRPPSPWDRRWDVLLDIRGWQAVREPAAGDVAPAGPFEVTGAIYPVTALIGGSVPSGVDEVGTARAFGWIYDARRGRGVGTIVLSIDDEGDIVLSGLQESSTDTWAVTGGTDRFHGARGDATVRWYNRAAGAFRIDLHIATI